MLYELIILSLLIRRPGHGYFIASVINDMIGPYARISNGRLYPLLAKLEANGLVELDAETQPPVGERNTRTYQITEAGKKRFHTLMLDTTSNPGEYQRLFHQKVASFYFLQPLERLYLIDHYINYSQAHILHLAAESDDLAAGNFHAFPGDTQVLSAILGVTRHIADHWRLEADWALLLRQQELANLEALHEPLPTE